MSPSSIETFRTSRLATHTVMRSISRNHRLLALFLAALHSWLAPSRGLCFALYLDLDMAMLSYHDRTMWPVMPATFQLACGIHVRPGA